MTLRRCPSENLSPQSPKSDPTYIYLLDSHGSQNNSLIVFQLKNLPELFVVKSDTSLNIYSYYLHGVALYCECV